MKPGQAVPPPVDGPLEAATIGACLHVAPGDDRPELLRILDESCFTVAIWREAWRAIAERWRAGEDADVVLISRAVAAATNRDVGTVHAELLAPIIDGDAIPWLAVPRAQKLRDLSVRRLVIDIARETTTAAYKDGSGASLLNYATKLAEMVDAADARDETGEIGPIADEVEYRAENGDVDGWMVGLKAYDDWSGGIHPGEVHVVGGGSGTGKTWLLGQLANAGIDAGRQVAFVTLEMGRDEIYTRLIAGRIGMIAFRLMGRARTWTAEEVERYREARTALEAGARIYADQRSVEQIEALTRRTQPDLVLVDYVQLLDWPKETHSIYEAVTVNADRLQRLAKRAHCTVVLATQMSRASLRDTSGVIQGGSESGRIDHVADLWTYIAAGEEKGQVKLTCRKNRHGMTGGECVCRLDPVKGRFV